MNSKPKFSFPFVLIVVLLFSGCGQLMTDAAKEELMGNYTGTVTYTSHLSQFNIGLDDYSRDEKCRVSITEISENMTILNLSDFGIITIEDITPAGNGCGFNIPEQKVMQVDKSFADIYGTALFQVGEEKCDGMYDSDKNILSFAFEGILPLDIAGNNLDTPISGVFKLQKNKLE